MGCSGDGERSMINRVLLLAGFSVSHTGVWRTLELSEEGEPVSRLLILPQSLHSALLNNAGAGEMAQKVQWVKRQLVQN